MDQVKTYYPLRLFQIYSFVDCSVAAEAEQRLLNVRQRNIGHAAAEAWVPHNALSSSTLCFAGLEKLVKEL